MLIEDELAGDWVYNDEPSKQFKTPVAGSQQAVKRTSALKKLYRNYSQSKEFEKQKQVRDQVRKELQILETSEKLSQKSKFSLKNASVIKNLNVRSFSKDQIREQLMKAADEQHSISKSSVDKTVTERSQKNGKKLKKLSKLLVDKPTTAEVPDRESLENFAYELNYQTKSVNNLRQSQNMLEFSKQQNRQ